MSNKKTFRYILRYKIDPSYNAQKRIDELLSFCQRSQTEEVMMFLPAEELSPGHPTIEELKPYVEMGKNLKDKLNNIGVDLSLNPWTTLYQISRGRKFRKGQNFTPMVGETGFVNKVAACPLCEKWQNYLCETYCYLAGELKPTALWIEDDWRLHNHDVESGWGGCFCELHLEKFSQRIGQKASREMILDKILASGTPHPWRDAWLQVSKESLLEPANKLRNAIEAVSPLTRLGLMSSVPDVHSAEGRDWHALQDAFGSKAAFLTRPHLPPYTETTAISSPPSVTRQTIACLKRPIEIYPELENSPRNGVYSKSNAFSIWECMNAAMYGSDGITINHFDMMGCGTSLDTNFESALDNSKPVLNSLVNLNIDDINSQGVNVLFSPEIGKYIHSNNITTLEGICQDSGIWSKIFYTLGISHQFVDEIKKHISPYVVSGQTLKAFDDEAIKTLLSNTVILDAYSVEILQERGFGNLIGIRDCNWQTLEESAYAYEEIHEKESSIYGLPNPRMTAQRYSSKLLSMESLEEAKSISTICKYDHVKLFSGGLVYKNKLGGTIASLAYPFNDEDELFMNFFNVFRRKFMQNLISELSPKAPVAFMTNHPAHVYRVQTNQGLLVAAFNIIVDCTYKLTFRLNGINFKNPDFKMLSRNGKWRETEIADINYKDNCLVFTINKNLLYLQEIFVMISES